MNPIKHWLILRDKCFTDRLETIKQGPLNSQIESFPFIHSKKWNYRIKDLYGILIPHQIKISIKFYTNSWEAFILIKIFKCWMKDKRDKLFKAFWTKMQEKMEYFFVWNFPKLFCQTVKAFIGQWNFHPFLLGDSINYS